MVARNIGRKYFSALIFLPPRLVLPATAWPLLGYLMARPTEPDLFTESFEIQGLCCVGRRRPAAPGLQREKRGWLIQALHHCGHCQRGARCFRTAIMFLTETTDGSVLFLF